MLIGTNAGVETGGPRTIGDTAEEEVRRVSELGRGG
jgi:hypothetical protein